AATSASSPCSLHDALPIFVVTGMGIMTSLGAGKADNWSKLVAGESGIRTITRFPVDGLKTTMAGTVDFVSVDPFSSTGLSERMRSEEHTSELQSRFDLVCR